MTRTFFTAGPAASAGYTNIRDAKDGPLASARYRCEYYWKFFERQADKEFLTEIREQFDARYWEMHLTASLILNGHEVTCPKPGPDVGIMYRGKRIWFEAVSANGGDPGKPDYVSSPAEDGISDVPNEKIVLRYLNSISEKYERKYVGWLAKGIVSKDDAYVIALNPRAIPFDNADTSPPRIIQAAYTAGNATLTIDRATHRRDWCVCGHRWGYVVP